MADPLTNDDIRRITDNVNAVNEWAEGNDAFTATMANGRQVPSPSKLIADARLYKAPIPYNAGTQFTDATQPVDEAGVIFIPNPSDLPIGPEAFDSNHWLTMQGFIEGTTLNQGGANIDMGGGDIIDTGIINAGTITGTSLKVNNTGNATSPALSIDDDGSGAGTGFFGTNSTGAATLVDTVDGVAAGSYDTNGNKIFNNAVTTNDHQLFKTGRSAAVVDPNNSSLYRTAGGGGSFPFNQANQLVIECSDNASGGLIILSGTTQKISQYNDAIQNVYFGGISTTPSASVHGMKIATVVDGTSILNSTSITSTKSHYQFLNTNGLVGTISTNGSATSYNTSSDERLKTEFENISKEEAYSIIIEAYENKYIGKFKWLNDLNGPTVWGYRAQALCENQAGFGGSEGDGPVEATIGEEYEQDVDKNGELLFEDIVEVKQRQSLHRVYKTKKVKKLDKKGVEYFVDQPIYKKDKIEQNIKQYVKMIDGKAVLIPKSTEMIYEQDYTDIPIEDENGNAVMENYSEVIGQKPVMKIVTPYSADQSKRATIVESGLYHAIKEIEALKNA